MRCDDARASYLAGPPDSTVQEHLDGCAECTEVLPVLRAHRATLTETAVWSVPDPELEERVVETIAAAGRPARRHLPWGWRLGAVAAAVVVAIAGVAGVRVLTADEPDWELPVAGAEAAPAVVGSVAGWNEEIGTRVRLRLDNVPRASAGTFYELWFSSETDHISAGTFVQAEDVELVVAVSRRDFPRVWMTQEPVADHDAGPSGPVIFDIEP